MAVYSLVAKEYTSDHEKSLLNNVNSFRKEREFCDVTFKVEGEEILAHRNILAAFSNYYRRMFLSRFKEGLDNEVTVVGITALILNIIINFIYTAKITINSETVYQLYEAADMLQIKYVTEYCVWFLKDTLIVENCVSIWDFAKLYSIKELERKCENLFIENVELVSNGLEFKELGPDETEVLIKIKKKQGSCEDAIFKGVFNWIEHDFKNRQQIFNERLFLLIKVSKLSTTFLENLTENELWMQTSAVFANALRTEIFHRSTNITQRKPIEVRPVEVASQLLVVGGYEEDSRNVGIFEVDQKTWRNAESTLEERHGSTSVKIKNHVYTAGGNKSKSVEKINLNRIFAGWQKVASMNEERYFAASAVLNAEVYNPVLDTWTDIAAMKTLRSNHAAVSYNGRLYAFGGWDGMFDLKSMEGFDPRTATWENLTSMTEGRNGLCGVVCNDEIYSIGGKDTVERYNIRTNTWSKIATMNYRRSSACACVINGKIYVIGGEGDRESEKTVEVYDPTSNKWEIETNMKIPRFGSSVIVF